MTIRETDRALREFADEVGAADPVAVAGSRTAWTVGGELVGHARIVSAPRGIVSVQSEEMTVHVRAGTTVAELDAALAEHGQRTALPDRGGTVGGALMVGQNDLRVGGRGRVRDSLLQMRYIAAAGDVIMAGAPTVKNVSGFDLPRLFIGSLGVLGLVSEVVLRTNPLPRCSRWVCADGVDPFVAHDHLYRPACVLWNGTRTWVQLEGHPHDVEDQIRLLSSLGDWHITEELPELPPYRWSCTPRDLRTLPSLVKTRFVSVIGVGTVLCDQPQPGGTVPAAVAELTRRLKAEFDPTGRLNPGRNPLRSGAWT
jgi:glycolate oxidase FAD binding subunit